MIRFESGVNCLYFPADDQAKAANGRVPAILFLHGIGERGLGHDDLRKVAAWGLPKFRAEGRWFLDSPFPFLVIAPQCPPDKTWCDPEVLDGLVHLVGEVTGRADVDASRLHITGFSMGGIGAFCLALDAPQAFASLSSVCGRCLTPDALPSLADLPAWIAYAEDDEIKELTNGSKNAIQKLVKYTKCEVRPYRLGQSGNLDAHVRTCDAAYAEPDFYQWLLAHRRRAN